MQQLQLYLQLKQLEQNYDRSQHQRFAFLAYECEQQLRDYQTNKSNTYIALINYIHSYVYNPFHGNPSSHHLHRIILNTQAIIYLENYNQIKFQQNLQIALQIDHQLLQYFDNQLRCSTIVEEDDDQDINPDTRDSFIFDPMKGLKLQQLIQFLSKSSKTYKYPKPTQPLNNNINSLLLKNNQNYHTQNLFNNLITNLIIKIFKIFQKDYQLDIINIIKINSIKYLKILNKEIMINTISLNLEVMIHSLSNNTFKNKSNSIKLRITKSSLDKPLLFQSPLQQDLLNTFELTNPNNNIQTTQNQIIFTAQKLKILLINYFIITYYTSQRLAQQYKKQPQIQQVSLLGSLFTPQVLKEMQYLNDDLLPQQEYTISLQYQEITVEKKIEENTNNNNNNLVNHNLNLNSLFNLKLLKQNKENKLIQPFLHFELK
ncbi:unnamed protein product [Paramecium sonneborni]|uniref:Uncharacterized protein n=1 Tax=Paramecium sonneborni TaxID=65129 RepID=A0A8S1RLT7_9CILI|nr:unnamed protein product [Paramecium sonneborni]